MPIRPTRLFILKRYSSPEKGSHAAVWFVQEGIEGTHNQLTRCDDIVDQWQRRNKPAAKAIRTARAWQYESEKTRKSSATVKQASRTSATVERRHSERLGGLLLLGRSDQWQSRISID